MGKYRGHQDKSRRGREKKLLKKKFPAAAETGAVAAGGKAASVGGLGVKRKLKHVTYAKEHSVLICGDGDFSFTRGVIRHRETGEGVVATSLDSRKAVLKKYPRAETWLAKLAADGAQVIHAVDATRLEETLLGTDGDGAEDRSAEGGRKKRILFDRVVFNFPHTGKQRTHLNRNLIRDFFASTKGLVKCAAQGGEVHVTLKDKPPYSGWNVKAMAKESGLVLVRTLAFDPAVFPGYRHSTTDPQAKEFDAEGARTNVFCRARSAIDDNVDDSGAFPVISKEAASSSIGKLTSPADDGGDGQADAKEGADNGGEDSDGHLFGEGGHGSNGDALAGEHGGSGEEEEGGDDRSATSRGSQSGGGGAEKGTKGRGRKKNAKGGTGAPVNGGPSANEGEENQTNERENPKTGMLQPPLQKKKAAKRREQRKKKAAAAKAAAATAAATGAAAAPATLCAAAGGDLHATASPHAKTGKAKTTKRKRGKYVVSAERKRARIGQA